MGEQNVKPLDTVELQAFSRRLLDDVFAFQQLLERGMIESGVRRIGAEQEFFLVDSLGRPAMIGGELLKRIDDEDFTSELARFNLEFNLPPRVLAGDCLSQMERDITTRLGVARARAREMDADIVMCGILPTIEKGDLTLDAMTPMDRYYQLNDILKGLRQGDFSASIKGLDDLQITHDNILFEACNTSFQIHFQVAAEEFAALYNLAQVVTGPVLACAVNSPLLLRHRLWHETRVALFQQSIDNRTARQSSRGSRPRVSFGSRWVKDSVVEIFREDIARFRILLSTPPDEDPMAVLNRGEAPKLSALRLHNGTVYRWNRPCYGISEGKAHLRIENRVLPAGPTAADEVANAAFFFGLMSGLREDFPDVTEHISFDATKTNFQQAAQFGLKAQFSWLDGQDYKVRDLILTKLIPAARLGLQAKAVDAKDIDRYLGIIEARVSSGQTGARWMLDSLENLGDTGPSELRYRTLVKSSCANQATGEPVHRWPIATADTSDDWRTNYRLVSQYMSTDLFTVRPEDLVDLAASVMDWEHLRHVPVEDADGKLVGLVTIRDMLRLLAKGVPAAGQAASVGDIMKTELITVTPETPSIAALRLMEEHGVSCLPVVDGEGLLAGLVTERDLLHVATAWMEEQLAALG